MKIFSVLLTFLCSWNLFAWAACSKYIDIDSPLIYLVDRHPKLSIREIVLTILKINQLKHGKGEEKKGVIYYKAKECTLNELIIIEKNIQTKDLKYFNESLNETIIYMKESTAYYRELLESYKIPMGILMKQWAKQRHKQHSTILKWAEMSEEAFIKNYVTSAEKMDHMLNDLVILLNDIRYSCKGSNEKFNKEMKKAIKNHHNKHE